MKKFLSSLAALLMLSSLSVPVFASETASISQVDLSEIQSVELALISQENTPRGRVDVYSFSIPAGGSYYEIPDFRNEYTSGTRITVEGTWKPTYKQLSIMFKDMETGASTSTYIDCNESSTFGLWSDSTWGCFVKSDSGSVTGTLSVEIS